MIHPNPWNELLELVVTGRGELLPSRATLYAADLATLRPLHTGAHPYARLVLHHDDRGEVMLATWKRGGLSAPHDHGLARGFVAILMGKFVETSYRFDGADLRASGKQERATGDLLEAQPGQIHDLYARDDGLTLHVYAPRIHGMRVYDRQSRTTLRVADDCGAWVPRTPEAVLERQPWLHQHAWTERV
jgi:hypothetical protein